MADDDGWVVTEGRKFEISTIRRIKLIVTGTQHNVTIIDILCVL